jgi:phosphoserine phosphatase
VAFQVATIALIFDFDDTLVPDSTTLLLKHHGIDTKQFWLEDAKSLVESGYDPAHAYLKLLLDNVGPSRPLGNLTNKDLRKFGHSKVEPELYPGLQTLFKDLKKIVASYRNIDIEFYVISGGLQEIIEGCDLIRKNCRGIYASQLGGDSQEGPLKYVKRCITFTEKTRFLFEINKGLKPEDTRKNPYLVNKDVAIKKRRIPWANMIYIGDGLTDIPCFSLVKHGTTEDPEGGNPFAVFDPREKQSAKRVFQDFLQPGRVLTAQKPEYKKRDALGAIIRGTVEARCAQIGIAAQTV